MQVFAGARLVFLSVPKTGTTAWQAALDRHASISVRGPATLKHSPLYRYNRFFRPMLERFVGSEIDIVAVMREPIDWLGSWYRYRQREPLDGEPTSTAGLSFDEFVIAYMQGKRPPFADVGSQAKFLEPQRNGTAVTHLFRYEDQEGLTAFLEDRLGTALKTRRKNVSPGEPPRLSPRIEARLRQKFEADFRLHEGIAAGGMYTPLPPRERG